MSAKDLADVYATSGAAGVEARLRDAEILSDAGEWPTPEPLPDGVLAPVAPFELDMMPAPFQPWVGDVAHRLAAPPDFVAVGALVAIASVLGRAVAIRPKQRDDWAEVPNLWGGVVAESGMYKSPSLKAALRFVNRLEAEAHEQHKQVCTEVERRELVTDAEIKTLRKRLQSAIAGASRRGRLQVARDDDAPPASAPQEDDPEALAAQLAALQRSSATPTRRRFIVNDPTVEKLGELLNENPRGLLLSRDELLGFLYRLEADGHEADRTFYLEAWNGNGQPFTYDRIQRGTIRIEAPCVSIIGGIQPRPLAAYIRSTWKGGGGEDGLLQRFQLLVWPDVPASYEYVDQWPDRDAVERAYGVFKRAAELGVASAVGAFGDADAQDRIPCLHFAPDAQPLFDAWYQRLMLQVRAGDDHPAIRSHLSKYASLMPSLALLFQVVTILDGGAGTAGAVGPGAATLAIRWIEYLETHARRVYGAITRRRETAAALLGAKLKAAKLVEPFTIRDVRLKGWAGLTEPEDVRLAVDELVEAGWLRSQEVGPDPMRGGRPTTRYEVNPKVRDA